MSGERQYDFDPVKERENQRKHGMGFDPGFAVLMQDELVLWQFLDQRNEHEEDRWITIGPLPGHTAILLLITWTERGDRIRLISVRRTVPAERRAYVHRYRRTR